MEKAGEMNKLRAVMIIVTGCVLTIGMASLPAQAGSVHAIVASSPKYYDWESAAGALGFMTSDATNVNSGLYIVANGGAIQDWTATGCQTLAGHVYCHQQIEGTNFCLSTYQLILGDFLRLDYCNAKGGNQQVDEQWWFSGSANGNFIRGTLKNYGDGGYAVSNGHDGDGVYLGTFSGANNNYWYYAPVSS
jgi:hypothetical protein